MTLIIGIEYDGAVYMGADAMGADHMSGESTYPRKIVRKGGVMIGYAGSYRFGQIVTQAVHDPRKYVEESDDAYLWRLVESIRSATRDYGINDSSDGVDGIRATALIAHNGKLYTLQSDYSYIRYDAGIAAVGTGYQYGLGALQAVYPKYISSPRHALKYALKATGKWCATVGSPYEVEVQYHDGA